MIPPVTRNVLCLDVLAPSQGEQRARAAEAAHLAAQRELAKLRGGMESVDSEKDEAASRELALREECDKMKVIKREAWDAMVWLALPVLRRTARSMGGPRGGRPVSKKFELFLLNCVLGADNDDVTGFGGGDIYRALHQLPRLRPRATPNLMQSISRCILYLFLPLLPTPIPFHGPPPSRTARHQPTHILMHTLFTLLIKDC